MLRIFVILALGAALRGDESFSPPLIGYVFDGGVRPMVGSPGAARVLPPLPIGGEIRRAAIAPGRDFAIVSVPEGGTLSLIRFNSAEVVSIADSTPDFDLASFNREGTAAAIHSSACTCIQLVTGLPDSPAVVRRIEVSGVIAIAISADGADVAYSDESQTVTSDGKHWPFSAAALSYSPDGSSLAIVDATRKSLSLARGAELSLVDDQLTEPTAIWFANPTTVLVADGRSVRAIDLDTGQVTATECPCTASVFEPTARKDTFRISDLRHGAVWIFERTGESSRVFFVPAPNAEGDQ